MQKLRAKQVASYAMLPGIVPRLQDLLGSGTGMLAFLIAIIFQMTRLLPATHPYVNPQNIRKFTVRDVFAATASRLVFDRNHLDQIFVFGIMVLGFVLFILQFVFLAGGLLMRQAQAAFFETAAPQKDIAFQLMDKVFGVPGFFGSDALGTTPTPFNTGLQELFKYYSYGLLLIAVIVFLYYVLVVVIETAQTGTPFGKRFAHIWAPIRLVVALGLLIPLGLGFNSGQYIVLEAAKMGSGFATNGWLMFNNSITNWTGTTCSQGHTNPIGVCDEALYARPKTPDSWPILKFMLLATTCRDAYAYTGVADIKPYLIKSPQKNADIDGYAYADALDFYQKNSIIIRFGKTGFDNEIGGVRPYCGEIMLFTTAADKTTNLTGPYTVQEKYYEMIKTMWNAEATKDFATVMKKFALGSKCDAGDLNSSYALGGTIKCDSVSTVFITAYKSDIQVNFKTDIEAARTAMIAAGGLAISEDIKKRGWGGAGIWYNHIAEINGSFFGATNYMPLPTLLPMPMQFVLTSKSATSQNLDPKDMFNPTQSGKPIEFPNVDDGNVFKALFQAWQILGDDEVYQSSRDGPKGNIIKDVINLIFGAGGIYTMRENTDIHPLAQLVGLGKGIVDVTVRNLFSATVLSAGGGMVAVFANAKIGGAMNTVGGLLVTLATISVSIGFLLYYVLPFLPFMYFFFAVGSWLKTIFEAMVGVPLWALGHLRIDGHGLPGESAVHGYYMIFEIFVRPILTVFGLIGGLITFTALVKVLNQIFQLVTDNLSGFDANACQPGTGGACDSPGSMSAAMEKFKRDEIDTFFFTVIYTIIVYMLATSSFKMIDQIPRSILRWMGDGVHVFASQIDDPEQGMNKYFIGGSVSMTSQLGKAINSLGPSIAGLSGRRMETQTQMTPKTTPGGATPGPTTPPTKTQTVTPSTAPVTAPKSSTPPSPPGGGKTSSDRRLKKDIVPIGMENGFKTYHFTYIDDAANRRYCGVMADEVRAIRPEAVATHDGYDAVDYAMIGVTFREV